MITRFSTVLVLILALSSPLLAQSDEGKTLGSANLFQQALLSRQENKTAEAIALFRQSANDQNYALQDYALFEIGETYYSAGDYRSSIPEYQKILSLYPKSILLPKTTLMLGKSYFNAKDFPSAIQTFQALVEKYPDAKEAAEARFLVAKAHEFQGKWKEAYLDYEETDLFHPLSYFGKRARKAILALKRKHRKQLPRFKASEKALFKKGMAYFEQDDFEMAANIFRLLARNYPKSKFINEAWLMLGRAEMQRNRYPSAISDLERATTGSPNLAGKANYYLGIAHGRRGKYPSAIASFKKVLYKYPDSSLADDAAYWLAYYQEVNGETQEALHSYYGLIKKYPYSKSVSAAIWRLGRAYYWEGDFKNAATYLHLAQLYPPGENSPRCYFFEAKALERLDNRAAALEVYKKLIDRFDHTYYAYRAQEKLDGFGISALAQPFSEEDFSEALSSLNDNNQEALASIMEIWELANTDILRSENSGEARAHLLKYKELMGLNLTGYAADEARYLVDITSEQEKDSAQIKLGEMLLRSGEYHRPIRFANRKVKDAVLSGKSSSVPKKIWQMAYPKGYWEQIKIKADNFKVDPYLVLAVIREESRFNPKAVSRSGARGLMQIMPKTGKGIARNLDLYRYRTGKLFDPKLNVAMGTYYLSNLVKSFSDNFYLALAGYNGGPNRVKRYINSWYDNNLGSVDIDEFIESIPSRETRLYVQKVMESYFEYKRLYERKRG
ncbi:MAG: tetratricopeptide repeat protein [bacterium]